MAGTKITTLYGDGESIAEQFLRENDPNYQLDTLNQEVQSGKQEIQSLKDKVEDTKAIQNSKTITTLSEKDIEALLRGDDDDDEKEKEEIPTEKKVETSTEEKETTTEESPEVKETDPSEPNEEGDIDYQGFVKFLADKGIVIANDDDEIENSEEGVQKAIQNTITREIDRYKNELPSVVSELVDYIERGGDPAKFLTTLAGPIDLSTLNLENKDDQKYLIREYLKSQEMDPEDILETIETYEDANALEKQAKIAQKKMARIAEAQYNQMIAEQQAEQKRKEDEYKNYISSLQKVITDSPKIAGLEVKDKEREEFKNYLLKKDKSGLTGYQRDIQANPLQTQVELAFLKFKKFDYSKVTKQAETTSTKKLKEILSRPSNAPVKGSSSIVENKPSEKKEAEVKAFRNFIK